MSLHQHREEYNKLHTLPQAARLLGLKVHALRRAVNRRYIPSYSCFNRRKMVKPAEVLAAMASHSKGGRHVGN